MSVCFETLFQQGMYQKEGSVAAIQMASNERIHLLYSNKDVVAYMQR
jgi:hypothetical protein